MDRELKKIYNKMTRKQAIEEVRLLQKELKPLYKQVLELEICLEYLDYKIN